MHAAKSSKRENLNNTVKIMHYLCDCWTAYVVPRCWPDLHDDLFISFQFFCLNNTIYHDYVRGFDRAPWVVLIQIYQSGLAAFD